jgi:hypothetical protein
MMHRVRNSRRHAKAQKKTKGGGEVIGRRRIEAFTAGQQEICALLGVIDIADPPSSFLSVLATTSTNKVKQHHFALLKSKKERHLYDGIRHRFVCASTTHDSLARLSERKSQKGFATRLFQLGRQSGGPPSLVLGTGLTMESHLGDLRRLGLVAAFGATPV